MPDGLVVGTDECIILGSIYVEVLYSSFGIADGIELGIDEGTELSDFVGSFDGSIQGTLLGFSLGVLEETIYGILEG